VATVGATNANCYISRTDAQTYFDGRLKVDEWTNASNDDKDRSLIMATGRLDQEEWRGGKYTNEQALKWPRHTTFDDSGYPYLTTAIPDVVEDATCELALVMLKSPTFLADSGLEGLEKIGIGSGAVSVEPRASAKAGALPENIVRLLRTVRRASAGISANVDRG
jgi:hypothetical protein